MDRYRYTYEDPTGGGEDILLIIPEWVAVLPDELSVRDLEGQTHIFELDKNSSESYED